MGHHHISEVNDEKFIFTGRSKAIVGLVFLVGLILTFIGVNQIKHEDAHAAGEAHVEEHASSNQELPVHTVGMQEHQSHGDEAHAAEHAEEAHAAEEAHGESDHGNEAIDAGSEEHAAEHGSDHGPTWLTRLWANLLLNSYYFMLFAVGALFFLAVNYASNAGWSTLLKRIIESITSYIPIGIITLVAVLYFGKEHLYHWVVYFNQGLEVGQEGYDKILVSKDFFLTTGWLLIGVPTIMLVWWLFRIVLVRLSHKEDEQGGLTFFKKSVTYSAAFLVVFAFSFSVLSWLVMMSIDPHWYSTIYSVYNFAIAFVTALTVICFFTLYLKSKGYMEVVSDEVIHDLGKFIFAFSIFWGYIFIAQFLLIWYANMTEESIYFTQRLTPHFKWFFRTNVIMCFALPLLVLMMRNAKRSPKVLLVAGSIILLGHWLDLFLMIMPGTVGQTAKIGVLEIGLTMAFAGLFIFWVLNNLSKKNLYAKNHPYLLESANHDVGV
ncbi:MAG: hypothetical protein ACI9UJ_000682 [bacterium]|jgi:hypothetical protein